MSTAARFVAFSTIDGEPWEAGADAAALLERVRSLSALGIGLTRFTEILDCGAEAEDVLSRGVPLGEARRRFAAVFRGEDPGVGPASVDPAGDGSEAGVRPREGGHGDGRP